MRSYLALFRKLLEPNLVLEDLGALGQTSAVLRRKLETEIDSILAHGVEFQERRGRHRQSRRDRFGGGGWSDIFRCH